MSDPRHGQHSMLVLLPMTRDVTLALINTDSTGWHFSAWYDSRIEDLLMTPDPPDRERRFAAPASAADYFRERYAKRVDEYLHSKTARDRAVETSVARML